VPELSGRGTIFQLSALRLARVRSHVALALSAADASEGAVLAERAQPALGLDRPRPPRSRRQVDMVARRTGSRAGAARRRRTL